MKKTKILKKNGRKKSKKWKGTQGVSDKNLIQKIKNKLKKENDEKPILKVWSILIKKSICLNSELITLNSLHLCKENLTMIWSFAFYFQGLRELIAIWFLIQSFIELSEFSKIWLKRTIRCMKTTLEWQKFISIKMSLMNLFKWLKNVYKEKEAKKKSTLFGPALFITFDTS